MLAALL